MSIICMHNSMTVVMYVQGPDILEKSTELIYSGELHKISKGHSQERHFFLFDRQLVYCKKVFTNNRW